MKQPYQQMIQIAEQPSIPDARGISARQLQRTAERQVVTERREVDARVDRELQGAPEAAVDLDQIRPTSPWLELVLEHGDAVPAKRAEELLRLVEKRRFDLDAFREHAGPARRRLLAKAPVRERGQHAAAIAQHEEADPGPEYPFLDEGRMPRQVIDASIQLAKLLRGMGVVHHRVLPAA